MVIIRLYGLILCAGGRGPIEIDFPFWNLLQLLKVFAAYLIASLVFVFSISHLTSLIAIVIAKLIVLFVFSDRRLAFAHAGVIKVEDTLSDVLGQRCFTCSLTF